MNNVTILAKTIFGEARGEFFKKDGGKRSLIAIGNVVMNRSKQSLREPFEECLRPLQFSCWNKEDPNFSIINSKEIDENPLFKICISISESILDSSQCDITQGADHYFSTTMRNHPSWAQNKKPTIKICNHLFFNLGYR